MESVEGATADGGNGAAVLQQRRRVEARDGARAVAAPAGNARFGNAVLQRIGRRAAAIRNRVRLDVADAPARMILLQNAYSSATIAAGVSMPLFYTDEGLPLVGLLLFPALAVFLLSLLMLQRAAGRIMDPGMERAAIALREASVVMVFIWVVAVMFMWIEE